MVLIEPGFIQTNFANAMVIAKKNTGSGFGVFTDDGKVSAISSELAKGGSSSDLVAKVILDVVKNPNPNLRYLVGKDVEAWAAGKKSMNETEFFNMIKNVTK
jgi:hypothetical protein